VYRKNQISYDYDEINNVKIMLKELVDRHFEVDKNIIMFR